jgi:putative oxygen-independent coproporphyrinogen III oxidase
MGTAIAHPVAGGGEARAPLVSPRLQALPPKGGRRVAVYVHFPWCLAKCPYCDFISYASPREDIDHDGYADAVISELESRIRVLGATEVGSIFFGGGTPSLWRPTALGRVLGAVLSRLKAATELEVTVECNPTSLDRSVADALAEQGVNRLSIGAQALRSEQLRFLGRLHDVAGALSAIEAALASRVPRVSADLIFGLPGQSPEDAGRQAESLASTGLRHISAYQLTIEPGTKFGQLARAGRLPRAEDGIVAEAFLAIDDVLSARGLEHYEISNYAARGEEARHNLAYWHGQEYLGLGCGAFGFLRSDTADAPSCDPPSCHPPSVDALPRNGIGRQGRGVRYRNVTDPDKYVVAALESRPSVDGPKADLVSMEAETLDAATLLRERIMLGLRLRGGFDLSAAADDLGIPPWTPERERARAWLIERGRLVCEGDRLSIPPRAWLWTDDTAARLF